MTVHRLLTTTLLIAATLFASDLAFAQSPGTGPAKAKDRSPIGYRILKSMAFDIDRVFSEKLGLNPVTCTFHDKVRNRSFEYDGLGACLYLNFRAGTKTTELPGTVDAVVMQSTSGKLIPIEISWRPAKGGMWDAFRRLFRTYRDKEMPPAFRSQALPGTIQVRFKEPVTPEGLFDLGSKFLFAGQEGRLEKLEFTSQHDEATGKEILGHIHLFLQGATEPSYDFHYRTDINVLNRRAFFVELEGE